MKIVVDASVLELKPTGVAKVLLGLYKSCLELRPDLVVEAVHRGPLTVPLPDRMRDRPWLTRMRPRRWQQFALAAAAGASRSIVHYPWNGGVGMIWPWTHVVVTLHDVLPLLIPDYSSKPFEDAYRRQRQRDLSRADLIMTDSEFSKREIQKRFSVRVEPIVVYPASLLPPAGDANREQQPPYFIYVGGYDARKGLESLLRVFIDLHTNGETGTRLVLVGEPHRFSESFTKLVDEGRNKGIVEETGYIDDARLASLLAGARGLIYPSKFEGFGLPPLEAMTLGCPVLTTRETSLPEICGDAALYADPDDAAAFGREILSLDRDAALRERLRHAGHTQARKFNWRESAGRYLAALDGISGGRS